MARRVLLIGGLLVAALAAMGLMHPTGQALVRYHEPPMEVVVPVAGVTPRSLRSSWGDPRPGHRTHEGIDIFARRGTPVVAATEGQVVRVGRNSLGGKVVWVAGAGARLYYYAHLDRYADGLAVGTRVKAGEVLGYVGNTGNARTTPPHLHFGVYPAERAFRAVDPAPILRHGRTLPLTSTRRDAEAPPSGRARHRAPAAKDPSSASSSAKARS
jgi:murein DD-endopeptidase MepM/ murein hydrolase activator NlpD